MFSQNELWWSIWSFFEMYNQFDLKFMELLTQQQTQYGDVNLRQNWFSCSILLLWVGTIFNDLIFDVIHT